MSYDTNIISVVAGLLIIYNKIIVLTNINHTIYKYERTPLHNSIIQKYKHWISIINDNKLTTSKS